MCFVCDFAVDQLLRQGWRTPARIITLVYTEMKTQDAALAYCQNNGQIPTTGQNCSQIRLLHPYLNVLAAAASTLAVILAMLALAPKMHMIIIA